MTAHAQRSVETTSGAEEVAEDAGARFESIGRAGWVAKGIVYGLVGVLFLSIATTGNSEEANQAGAIEKIAETPFGGILLVGLAVGLFLYAIWRLFTVILPGDWNGKALLDRIGYAVSTVVYLSLLWTTIGFIRSGYSDSSEREDRLLEQIVKELLEVPLGRVAIIVGGLIVIGIGGIFARKGWTRSFRDDMSGASGTESTAIDHLGIVGWTARGASMAIIGVFLIQAAWTYDPEKAAGLDDSMRQLMSNSFGAALASLVGAGFIAYGAFAVLSARHRNLEGPTND